MRDNNELYHLLLEMDPDELVGVLDLSSEEILRAFPRHVEEYIAINNILDDEFPFDDLEEDDDDDTPTLNDLLKDEKW